MKHSVLLLCAMQLVSAPHTHRQSVSVPATLEEQQHLQNQSLRAPSCVGPRGPRGPMGPPGPAGTFSAAYGKLSVSAQDINFFNADTWLPIPFDAMGPSSDMDVSLTSPATITVQEDGVYQINVSIYFSVEDSDEDTFTVTTYTLGLNINGVTTPVAAVYVGQPGFFSLSTTDEVQFYMEASDTDGPPFANNVTLEDGNAYLMQISD
jgi:hypothetical protein